MLTRTLARLLQYRAATLFAGLQAPSASSLADRSFPAEWKSGKQKALPPLPLRYTNNLTGTNYRAGHPVLRYSPNHTRRFRIVPNYTTNSRGLTEEIITATARYAGAVAVSAYAPYADTLDAVVRLKQAGVTTNLHFILTSRSVETAIEWLRTPPEVLTSADAIVFLNYKPVGRSADESLLLNKSSRVGDSLNSQRRAGIRFRIGFDTCTITGLARLGKAPKVTIEGCDAGRFSLFVSEDMEVYPCSFMVEAGYRGVSLRNTTLRDIWLTHPSFAGIRAKHRSGGCVECTALPICLSGCPLFPEMNLCPSKYSKINSGPATAR